MTGGRFQRAFDQLLDARRRYDADPRDVENIEALAQARLELDEARQEVAAARPETSTARPRPRLSDADYAQRWKIKAQAVISQG